MLMRWIGATIVMLSILTMFLLGVTTMVQTFYMSITFLVLVELEAIRLVLLQTRNQAYKKNSKIKLY